MSLSLHPRKRIQDRNQLSKLGMIQMKRQMTNVYDYVGETRQARLIGRAPRYTGGTPRALGGVWRAGGTAGIHPCGWMDGETDRQTDR